VSTPEKDPVQHGHIADEAAARCVSFRTPKRGHDQAASCNDARRQTRRPCEAQPRTFRGRLPRVPAAPRSAPEPGPNSRLASMPSYGPTPRDTRNGRGSGVRQSAIGSRLTPASADRQLRPRRYSSSMQSGNQALALDTRSANLLVDNWWTEPCRHRAKSGTETVCPRPVSFAGKDRPIGLILVCLPCRRSTVRAAGRTGSGLCRH
jgi:hypothetical protein